MRSANKDAANRRNAARSTGPSNTVSTRYNALKHGLLADGVTELDDRTAFEDLRSRLEADHAPQGELERFLVGRMALGMLRLKRSALMEAEFITATLNRPQTHREGGLQDALSTSVLDGVLIVDDPGLPARMTPEAVDDLNSKFMRYEASVENRLFRASHELERLQRSRKGDVVPPPSAVDITVHCPEPSVASFGSGPTDPVA